MIAVTDRHLFDGCPDPKTAFLSRIAEILSDAAAPPRFLVLREKDLPEKDYRALAEKMLALQNPERIPIHIHAFPEAARALGVTRLHLPFPMLERLFLESPALLSFFRIIGTSVHSKEEALQAVSWGASYLFAGNVFKTSCKPGLASRGLPWLQEITSSVQIPVYAIGGITEENLPEILSAGAADGCMRSGFMVPQQKRN